MVPSATRRFANFWGTDSFTYSAVDGPNVSAPATVYITVNSTPVANDDAFTTQAGQELDTSVSGDISDPNGGSLYTVLLTSPANGQLTLDTYGNVSYVPNYGFTGTDSFTYYATDGYAAISAPATVTITVTGVLAANNDNYVIAENGTLTIANATQCVGALPDVMVRCLRAEHERGMDGRKPVLELSELRI